MPTRNSSVHVATTKRSYNGKVYQSHLLRRSFRQDGKVKHETLGNLSHLPPDLIETIRQRLRGELPVAGPPWKIRRAYPHGHVAAVLGMLRDIGLEGVLASRPSRERDIVVALIVARVIAPGSKLSAARALREETATHSLALELALAGLEDAAVYQALDWLLARQARIENKLAHKHLGDGSLVLYDVSSSTYTGHVPTLAQFGDNRDGDTGDPQIVYGLLCNGEGRPVAIEVFPGNTADPTTFTAQVQKVRQRFGLKRVVLVGDRGMITSARIDEDLRGVEGLDWITALRADGLKKLQSQGTIQPSLFDERDLAEVTSPDYPHERLVVCRNPWLADERRRKREELLRATERDLEKILAATRRVKKPLRGAAEIGLRVGRVLNAHKMGKHFELQITDEMFACRRKTEQIAAEAALDGLYVIRTSLAADVMAPERVVARYKDLSQVESAFRSLKTVDLKIRPIYHWLDDRIRAHVFLCMLAYYVEWHMRQRLAPVLFDDDHKDEAEQKRPSIVAPAERSNVAKKKHETKRSSDDLPISSFRTLLQHLATLTKNRIEFEGVPEPVFMLTTPTPLQERALQLLGLTVQA
ncbi:MAG: IS1634 family transposase [Dongiaceae bacterium]